MTKDEWNKRFDRLFAEMATDKSLGDEDYIDVLESVESTADMTAMAKREEMEREDDE